jgi:hypothetical protein
MSKQLKYKFKKTLKEADFLQADLEFHENIMEDAELTFQAAIREVIEGLSAEDRLRLTNLIEIEKEDHIQSLLKKDPELAATEEKIIEDKLETEIDNDISDSSDPKTAGLKKLFHKIAGITHPDKAQARGIPKKESERLETLFKIATDAYQNQNWYALYSLALSLNIEISELSERHIIWIEDEIRQTQSQIRALENLLPWIWFHGADHIKELALQDYFRQVFNFDYAPKNSQPIG